jgi:hypothetical protein
MKKAIKIVIALAIISSIIGYCVNQSHKERIKREAQEKEELAIQAEKEKKRKSVQDAIKKMVQRYNAVNDWAETIKDKDKIFSMELEKVWVLDRPILFIGNVRDIKNLDKKNYQVEILLKERNIFSFEGTDTVEANRVRARLKLDLRCNKNIIDTFLKENPNVLKSKNASVAVIARIKHVSSFDYFTKDDKIKSGNTGSGDCLDILLVNKGYSFLPLTLD